MDNVDIDEVMTRLERGETLMIDDQMRTYISMESDDTSRPFVTRSILARLEDQKKPGNLTYRCRRFRTLADVLLSLMDWEWKGKSAKKLTQVAVIRDDRPLKEYKPGEIGKPFQLEPGHWYIACPECGVRTSLSDHQITENEDGTITISPSIPCRGSDAYGPCDVHYFVERNQIEWI